MLNYDQISTTYDNVRQADLDLVTHLAREANITDASCVLDIGCGTGNYADLLQRLTHAHVFGVEPSEGMLTKARQKNPNLVIQQSDAEHLPFEASAFDFVYMTDVIHHIPHIDIMFAEVVRVLKPNARVCIVTQSHRQIDNRPISSFFPATAVVDKARYPDIPQIISAATAQNLTFLKSESQNEGKLVILDEAFLTLVKTKGYSMLRLISDNDYQAGLNRLEHQLEEGTMQAAQAGDTLVWLSKMMEH
jgi:ubiquinone/menaquinone biosynthesis C-methylase UbiE